MSLSKITHIRDPLYSTIALYDKELKLINNLVFQRLRNIKQLGFADLAFSGATHSRYSHSLGAMHLATKIFDSIFRNVLLDKTTKAKFRQVLRLAVLFHDLGHPPLSHSTEMLMPKVENLSLNSKFNLKKSKLKATHEDYTIKFILDSQLTQEIEKQFYNEGIYPIHIASLISEVDVKYFTYKGLDYTPILQQIVASEIDADRMDYLNRDSFYCGVNYGKFDTNWLIENLIAVQENSSVFLGIHSDAIFSFEDFLLSRYHMFVSVYQHPIPVIFEKFLTCYFADCAQDFLFSYNIEKYLKIDDINLWYTLRKSKNKWAKRIVEYKPYYLLNENKYNKYVNSVSHTKLIDLLKENNIHYFRIYSKNILSKYYNQSNFPLFVITSTGQQILLQDYSQLYSRYYTPSEVDRIFVSPDNKKKAFNLLKTLI